MVYINSFDYDFINEYLVWKGLDLCEVCGEVIEKKVHNKTYCTICAKKKEVENTRYRVKAHRNKKM